MNALLLLVVLGAPAAANQLAGAGSRAPVTIRLALPMGGNKAGGASATLKLQAMPGTIPGIGFAPPRELPSLPPSAVSAAGNAAANAAPAGKATPNAGRHGALPGAGALPLRSEVGPGAQGLPTPRTASQDEPWSAAQAAIAGRVERAAPVLAEIESLPASADERGVFALGHALWEAVGSAAGNASARGANAAVARPAGDAGLADSEADEASSGGQVAPVSGERRYDPFGGADKSGAGSRTSSTADEAGATRAQARRTSRVKNDFSSFGYSVAAERPQAVSLLVLSVAGDALIFSERAAVIPASRLSRHAADRSVASFERGWTRAHAKSVSSSAVERGFVQGEIENASFREHGASLAPSSPRRAGQRTPPSPSRKLAAISTSSFGLLLMLAAALLRRLSA